MPLFGAHLSIAGGYYKAADAAAALGMDVVQLFTKNNNQWRAKPISAEEVERFRQSLQAGGITHPIAHASYLINLAAPDDELWKRSIDAYVIELQRAEALGIPFVIVHPGAFTHSSEAAGLNRIAMAVDEVHRQCRQLKARCALENTAGQGTCLGWKFEQLAAVLDAVRDPERLAFCFDTCHAFAAGYPLAPRKAYDATFAEFDRLVGIDRICAFHLNDSKRPQGSRVDRHEHIRHGALGKAPFRLLVNDLRFAATPMYLETPKDDCDGEPWDAVNLRVLRALCKTAPLETG